MTQKYIKLKDKDVPTNIRSYKKSKSIKIYFKGNVLNISKPKWVSINEALLLIQRNENDIYDKYIKILNSEIKTSKQWKTGEKIYYKGEQFEIVREYQDKYIVSVRADIKTKKLFVILPKDIEEAEVKKCVDNAIKRLFKNYTETLILEKLLYWSKKTNLKYNAVKVRDATTRYGSCMPAKRNLYFSSRLIMLPENVIDAIIVHELCHLKFKNHNKDFYNLVEQYIPNYKEIDKWLKQNGKLIMF